MSNIATVRNVGNSLTLTLTDYFKKLRIGAGDTVYVIETPTGIEISKYDPAFEEAMEAARDIIDQHPNMMRELAK